MPKDMVVLIWIVVITVVKSELSCADEMCDLQVQQNMDKQLRNLCSGGANPRLAHSRIGLGSANPSHPISRGHGNHTIYHLTQWECMGAGEWKGAGERMSWADKKGSRAGE